MTDGAGAMGRLKAPPDRLQALSTELEAFSRGARASAVQLLARPLREAAAASLEKILEVEWPRRAWARNGHATWRRPSESHGTDGTYEGLCHGRCVEGSTGRAAAGCRPPHTSKDLNF